jgi:chitinase
VYLLYFFIINISTGGFNRFNALRNVNANLKTMIAIGGWNANSSIFSDIVTNPTIRQTFVTSLYDFVKLYGFNGLDLDWEYPGQRGGRVEDKVRA